MTIDAELQNKSRKIMKQIVAIFTICLFVFSMGMLHSQLVQITHGEFRNIHLHWFPDSERLISTTNQGGKVGMSIISASNGEAHRVEIGDDFSGDYYTSVSPDGKWILFDARKNGSGFQVWKVSVHGGVPEQMTQNGGMMPSWSPDGNKFAYVHENDIYVKDLKSGEERKIIDASRADFHPCWSPDGQNLAFNPVLNDNYEICIVSISGENLVNISDNPSKDIYPCWSPDGSKIVFNSDRSGTDDLWIYDVKNKRLEQLTSGKNTDTCATWSPDGSKIAFSSDRSGKILDVWTIEVKSKLPENQSNSKYLGQKPPGIVPEIFAPGFISTANNIEFAGTFSPDFDEYFFTRRKTGTIENRIYHVRFIGERWTEPELAPFGYDCFEFEPHIAPEGNLLFFGSRRPVDDSNELARGTRIWTTKKTESGWSEPEYLGPPFDDAMFVCMAEDGTLYNSGLTKSEPDDGKYGPWEKIAPHLYGPYMHPCIGPDESFVIFDSDHVLDGQGKSLLISFRKPDGSWGDIISFRKLDQFKNLEKFGIPMLTPDKKYLFFSYRGDIYWVDAKTIENLRPKELK